MRLLAFYFVGDMARAVGMYSRLLEKGPDYRDEDWAEFGVGDARFALHLREGLSETSEPGGLRYGAIVSFDVPDIRDAATRAQEAGFRLTQEPKKEPFGWLASLQDPWGNILKIHESFT